MQGATGTILEYMDNTYEAVDDTTLEEFKACLVKMFAFQCGTHLGACYIKGTDATKGFLDEIGNTLSYGV